jgi:hypothetical protein
MRRRFNEGRVGSPDGPLSLCLALETAVIAVIAEMGIHSSSPKNRRGQCKPLLGLVMQKVGREGLGFLEATAGPCRGTAAPIIAAVTLLSVPEPSQRSKL